jgi:sugar phosphate isomerase/epimerase
MTSDRTVPRPDFKLGIQLYGLGDAFRLDMRGTLKALAEFGYQGIELVPPCETAAESLAGQLPEFGLEAIGFYAFHTQELSDPAHATCRHLRTLGIRHVTIGFAERVNKDWPAAIEETSRLAGTVRRQGLTLDYHNHEQEWQRIQGRSAMEMLAEHTSPDLVQFELDTHMMLKAGEDPCPWIQKYAGRMTRLHLKDINLCDHSIPVFGTGDLNARAVLETAVHASLEWLIIEFHPQTKRPPLDIARLCLEETRKILSTIDEQSSQTERNRP